MYVEFDNSYWSKYSEGTGNPSMKHLAYCKGMIDALKSLSIWSSIEEDLPIKYQIRDADGYLCDRNFVCGLTEAEWKYVGNLLVTLPNYPTPLFFFCAYPLLVRDADLGYDDVPIDRTYGTKKPLVFVSFGLNNFEEYSSSEQHFTPSSSDIIRNYDITGLTTYNIGDLVTFDGNVYRCLVDDCETKPWANRNHWLPQFEQLQNPQKVGKKIYTAGLLAPKYLFNLKSGDSSDAPMITYYYNKPKAVANWYLDKDDIVYSWRIEDVPYAKGTIVEYKGRRYKNVSNNANGCSCIPMPYNFTPPYGCSGHWLPEFFEDLPIEAQSPILPIFSSEERKIKGKAPDDYIISYFKDTLTFVDCVCVDIVERGWKDAHLCVDDTFPGKGDAWVSISPGPINNLQTDVLCDYFVFGGRWALGDTRVHFAVSRDFKYSDVSKRADYVGNNCPKSTILYNSNTTMSISFDSNKFYNSKFSDLHGCGLINASVDSKDGSAQSKLISDEGINLSSDYPMRLVITTDLRSVDFNSNELYYKDSNYTLYIGSRATTISTETNYCTTQDNINIQGLVHYNPLYMPNSSKGKQELIHEKTMLKSQLNGINYLAPIWMYVRREPVVLDNWSTVYRSPVLFACDATYSDYKSRLIVDGKTYIVFKYLVSSISTNDDRCGVAILVDEGEY